MSQACGGEEETARDWKEKEKPGAIQEISGTLQQKLKSFYSKFASICENNY